MKRRRTVGAVVLGLAASLSGCASTRVAEIGRLPNAEHLVTVVVTEDRKVVEDQCPGALALGPIYGCEITRPTSLGDGTVVRLIKIVRFTDRLPSPMALEIDVHELCHAVASLQEVPDPCHVGNNGFLQTAPRTSLSIR